MNKVVAFGGVLFTLALGLLFWSLAYALILQFMFNDGAILNALAKNTLVAMQQAYTYRSHATIQLVSAYAAAPTLLLFGIMVFLFLRPKGQPFGDARFATISELRTGGFFKKKGIILGKFGHNILRANDDRHHLVIGPTRSGKGTNYVVPNMLEYQGSIIVTDLKGELWDQTSAHRKAMGDEVFLFSPAQSNTHRYNPLDFIRPGRGDRTTDIQNMAQILVPDDKNSSSSVWQATSRQVIAGMMSYIQESSRYDRRRNFGEINALLSTGMNLQEVFKKILKVETDLSKFTQDSFNNYIALPEKAAQSALLDLQRATAIFRNEQVLASTMVTDIDISNLQRNPMSIYLAPNVADMTILMPLLRLFIQQTLDRLVLEHDPNARKVWFLLDEFRQLGRMDEIVNKLPYVAGYNIKMSFIIQDLKSLDDIYGESTRQSMLANCGYQLVLGANDQATAEYVSKSLGKQTIEYETLSRQIQFMGAHKRSQTQQLRERDLLMSQEVRQLPAENLVIFVEGKRPIYGKKNRAYADRPWRRLVERSQAKMVKPDPTEFPTFTAPPMLSKDYISPTASIEPEENVRPVFETIVRDNFAQRSVTVVDQDEPRLPAPNRLEKDQQQKNTLSKMVDLDSETLAFEELLRS